MLGVMLNTVQRRVVEGSLRFADCALHCWCCINRGLYMMHKALRKVPSEREPSRNNLILHVVVRLTSHYSSLVALANT